MLHNDFAKASKNYDGHEQKWAGGSEWKITWIVFAHSILDFFLGEKSFQVG